MERLVLFASRTSLRTVGLWQKEEGGPMEATELLPATAFSLNRYHVDLTTKTVRFERISCEDLEDALGGVARATKLLDDVPVSDPYDPSAPLVMNLGILSGTRVMTGQRTFFHGYSPLKTSLSGVPGLMWSAGSGHFGVKLRGLGLDEVIFTGRCPTPSVLRLTTADDSTGFGGPTRFEFMDGTELVGMKVNDRLQNLHRRYPDAHFAVIGPAGSNYEAVRYAAIALSTDNQLKSGEPKPRFAGRGGYGGVMGSKNLIAIIADGPNPKASGRGLKEINREINLGEGSLPFRDQGGGGTWRQMVIQHDAGILPELNFNPPGDDRAVALQRPVVEQGQYVVKAEGCYLCGIKCHKNVYQHDPGTDARFRVKLDYEPLALLSANLGIYEPDDALTLVELSDEYCMDSISLGVTMGYAMEWNRRHPDSPIAGGLAFGDAKAAAAAIIAIGEGALPELGQGAFRLAREMGEPEYAMQSKGVELPAYLPHSNPGYPWALAGGHTSMRTYLFTLIERDTSIEGWVNAITNLGPKWILFDIDGLCKFANFADDLHAEAIRLATGLEVTTDELMDSVARTFTRGYANERRRGFTELDYALPAESHERVESSTLPYFNTAEWFDELRARVMEILDVRARDAGLI
jgi:aldehyde:ferredoxin oxidoreductase